VLSTFHLNIWREIRPRSCTPDLILCQSHRAAVAVSTRSLKRTIVDLAALEKSRSSAGQKQTAKMAVPRVQLVLAARDQPSETRNTAARSAAWRVGQNDSDICMSLARVIVASLYLKLLDKHVDVEIRPRPRAQASHVNSLHVYVYSNDIVSVTNVYNLILERNNCLL